MFPHMDLIIEVLAFLISVAVVFAVIDEVERIVDQRRRLAGGAGTRKVSAGAFVRNRAVDNRFFQWVQASTSISDPHERTRLSRELSSAGFEHPTAPIWYVIIRFSLAIGFPAAYIFLQSISSKPTGGFGMILGALILCAIGFMGPSIFVGHFANARRTKLEFEFPDALDLMVVCVEAGLSLDATFVRVSDEMRDSHRRIAREFARVSEEINAGRTRAEALRTMAERADVAGIKSFVTLIIQSEALGASIAQTLRTYSTEMRETRFIKAEEKAMRIPVLMTVPLVACILPVIVAAVMLPVIIDVVRVIIPALVGHHGGSP